MKKTLLVLFVCVALAAVGCKKKEEAPKPVAPKAGMPADATHQGDPHAGLKPAEQLPAGPTHKGKVLSTMDSGGFTYVEIEEKGQKLWAAGPLTKVKAGDTVEIPDAQPMVNFQSKTLNRTFEKILFVPVIKVGS